MKIRSAPGLLISVAGFVALYLILGASYYLFLGNPDSKNVALAERHQPSDINTTFDVHIASFADYLTASRHTIAQANPYAPEAATAPSTTVVHAWNSPFEWEPDQDDPDRWDEQLWEPILLSPGDSSRCAMREDSRYEKGVLLIHGLTDSAFSMRDVGRFFLKRCFLVRALLLPGHGTRPGDLLHISRADWVAATQFGIETLQEDAENVYVVGFSTGGAASIHYGLTHAETSRIKALILFSPAVAIKNPKVALSNWHKAYTWIPWFVRMKWNDLAEDRDLVKYESFPKNAADQIYLLTRDNEALLAQGATLPFPLFVAASEEDATVRTEATLDFFTQHTNPNSRLILYATASDASLALPADTRIRRLVYATDPQIKSFAHTAIPVAPANPHYGKVQDGKAVYVNCLHYGASKYEAKWSDCMAGEGVVYGETSLKDAFVLRRLTYNPEFAAMMDSLDVFLEALQEY